MTRISSSALEEVRKALRTYENEVNDPKTNLARHTRETYLVHAEHFVRWMAGDFTPGGRTSRQRG